MGFVSFRELRSEELFGVLKSMELANAVRRKSQPGGALHHRDPRQGEGDP